MSHLRLLSLVNWWPGAPPKWSFSFCTDNWLLIRIGPGFLGSAPKFTSSSFFFGRIYAFFSIFVSFSKTFISSNLAFLLLFFLAKGSFKPWVLLPSSGMGAPQDPRDGSPRDPNNGIFSNWSRFAIKYIFHKVYFILDERTKIGSDFCGLPIQSLFHVLVVHWED